MERDMQGEIMGESMHIYTFIYVYAFRGACKKSRIQIVDFFLRALLGENHGSFAFNVCAQGSEEELAAELLRCVSIVQERHDDDTFVHGTCAAFAMKPQVSSQLQISIPELGPQTPVLNAPRVH